MARGIEDRLAALRALDTSSPTARAVLRDALATTSGIVIAAAARRIADAAIETLVPELADAFERLCTGLLDDHDERAEAAALALGGACIVGSATRADALAAARALATFKEDTAIAERLRQAAAAQKDAGVRREIADLLA